MLFFILVAGVIALILRFRRSVGLERLPSTAGSSPPWRSSRRNPHLGGGDPCPGLRVSALVLLDPRRVPAVPIAIVIAVSAHRLYELDRIIAGSPTLRSHAILVGVFGAGVIDPVVPLAAFARGQTIAVAGRRW
jgi:hypothetical protein